MFAPQCPQQPQLVTLQAVNAGRAVLGVNGNDCKFAGNSDPLRGIIASNSDPF